MALSTFLFFGAANLRVFFLPLPYHGKWERLLSPDVSIQKNKVVGSVIIGSIIV